MTGDYHDSLKRRRLRKKSYHQMLALYPTRINPGWALWSSVHAVKPQIEEGRHVIGQDHE
jgi:hypothetical protein